MAKKVDKPLVIRDRVKDLRRVKASELRANAHNWRTHPTAQREALRGILEEVGFAGAALARELPDGSLELIDGHLRAETAPNELIPVLVVDLNDAEAAKLLAVHDPIAAMAGADAAQLDALLRDVQTGSEALAQLITNLADSAGLLPAGDAGDGDGKSETIPESFQVIAECKDAKDQQRIYDLLTKKGVKCRVLTL